PQDLKGKIVTGTRPGASADSALRLYLRRAGLVPDKDVIFISVGDNQQGRMNALHRGSVSATVLSPPYSGMAKQFGLRELADLRKSDRIRRQLHRRDGELHQEPAAAGGKFSQRLYRIAAFF